MATDCWGEVQEDEVVERRKGGVFSSSIEVRNFWMFLYDDEPLVGIRSLDPMFEEMQERKMM